MSLNRRAVLAFGAAACASPALASGPGLAAVLDRHTLARGGAKAIEAMRSVRVDLEIEEQGVTLKALYRATKERRMRIDVFLDGRRVFSEGLDAAGAWSWPGDADAPTTASDAGRMGLEHGVDFNLYGLHDFPALGHRLELDASETIDGVTYPVVKITMRDGFTTYRYIDPKSWMIARSRDVRALHPDGDPTKKLIENVFEDYRPVAGVMTSFRSHQADVAAGKVMQRTRLIGQDVNLPDAKLDLERTWRPA